MEDGILEGDGRYEILCDKLRSEVVERKEKWTMCEIAEMLENRGIEKGIQTGLETGIMAMIRENLDMGVEKKTILEKLVKYFSFTLDVALNYYERVVVE